MVMTAEWASVVTFGVALAVLLLVLLAWKRSARLRALFDRPDLSDVIVDGDGVARRRRTVQDPRSRRRRLGQRDR